MALYNPCLLAFRCGCFKFLLSYKAYIAQKVPYNKIINPRIYEHFVEYGVLHWRVFVFFFKGADPCRILHPVPGVGVHHVEMTSQKSNYVLPGGGGYASPSQMHKNNKFMIRLYGITTYLQGDAPFCPPPPPPIPPIIYFVML